MHFIVERQVRIVESSILNNYIEKIYGYAINRTYTRDEADDLAQEILYTAVKELPKLKDDSRFEAWLWGIASNVTKSFRRYMGKQRAMYSYDSLESVNVFDIYEFENGEVYENLRAEISMLSKIYRDIIILYYYDNLPVRQIAEKLGIPEGTVTWRLSEGRSKLKKECGSMNETALRPIKLKIGISGDGNYNGTTHPFPYVFIQDALSQNILYYCYVKPKSIEELAKLAGIPAFYIEDCVHNLMEREAVSEPVKGKYRTEFMIYTESLKKYNDKVVCLFEPVVDVFVRSLSNLTEAVKSLGIYTAGKPDSELIYLYGLMALEYLSSKYNPVKYVERPVRYDGCRWSYHAHLMNDNKNPIRGLGREESVNIGSRGHYSHYSYHFDGFTYRKMMYDTQINICEDILEGRAITDIESAASAIAEGYIIKNSSDDLFVTIPAFNKKQKAQFNTLADDAFSTVISDYVNAVSKYVSGYKNHFPLHLEDDVARACNYMFITLYATTICQMANERGLMKQPVHGSVCDVLIQFK
jgi:RNA polymerase sigma factor (sigma-70 family)